MRERYMVLCAVVMLIVSQRCDAIELLEARLQQSARGVDLVMLFDKDSKEASIQVMTLGQPARLMITLLGVHTALSGKQPGLGDINSLEFTSSLQSTRLLMEAMSLQDVTVTHQQHIVLVHISPRPMKQVSQQRKAVAHYEQTNGFSLPSLAKNTAPVSLDVQRLPIRSALAMLAEAGDINMVVADHVEGEITLKIDSLPWEKALLLVLDAQGLAARRHGDALIVARRAEMDAIVKQEQRYSGDGKPLVLEVLSLRYAQAEQMAALIGKDKGSAMLSERGHVGHDPRTNQLLVSDTPARLNGIRHMVERLDVPLRQVQIEARIVIARENVSRRLGIQWGQKRIGHMADARILGPNSKSDVMHQPNVKGAFLGLSLDLGSAATASATLGLGFLERGIQLGLELNALELEGLSQTLSKPRIMTLDRQSAKIRQGQEVPYQKTERRGSSSTTFRDAVLALEVVPQLTPDDRVLMSVDLQNDSVSNDSFNGLPAINTSRMSTQVMVDNGETVVLGGILTQEQSNDLRKVPWLGDIPALGRLFHYAERAHEQVELLVFITPNIINEQRITG